jgi:hypothetical protein
MKPIKCLAAAIALLGPLAAHAGQVYGSVTTAGNAPVANAAIEIKCGDAVTPGGTDVHGAYRINVPQQGQCALTLTGFNGRPSGVIFSKQNPSLYNFQLVQRPDGVYELHAQ